MLWLSVVLQFYVWCCINIQYKIILYLDVSKWMRNSRVGRKKQTKYFVPLISTSSGTCILNKGKILELDHYLQLPLIFSHTLY